MAEPGRSWGTTDGVDPQVSDGRDVRDGFLSVARTALFLMDLVAVQQLLDGHRLITPEVEGVLVEWMIAHASDLESVAGQLHSIADDPARIAVRRDAVEEMLGELVSRLPVSDLPVEDRSILPHAS